MIETRLKAYLRDNNRELSEDLIEEFGEACKTAIRRQLSGGEQQGYSIRLSQIGKPVCQQQYEKLIDDGLLPEYKDYKDNQEYNLPIKFLLGDVIEAIVLTLLKASGVQVECEQMEVTYKGIGGTMDCVLDGKVYDIKSCSDYAFNNKFSAGFQSLRESDDFGYLTQLYGYTEGSSYPSGGWIAMHKVTGEVVVCDTPICDNAYKKESLSLIDKNYDILTNTNTLEDILPQFEPEDETYYKKKTGRKTLHRTCTYCPFKKGCYPNASYEEITYSKAKNVKKRWYV